VESVVQKLDKQLGSRKSSGSRLRARAHFELTYAHEILSYTSDSRGKAIPQSPHSPTYQTDILISEHKPDETWIPRIVIECKLGDSRISTHDALTYSAKAATHKHVHPYLRYGILLGAFNNSLPYRLVRHGSYFDFMVAWRAESPSTVEWNALVELIKEDVKASRALQDILTNRSLGRNRYVALHKPVRLVPYK
jgi:hypothetical protein